MPSEFPSSVQRRVRLFPSALDESGSNDMSGVVGKSNTRGAAGMAVVPRGAHTGGVEREPAAKNSAISFPHIVIRVGQPRKCLSQVGWGNSVLAGCKRRNGRTKQKAWEGPDARLAVPRLWRRNQQRPEPDGIWNQVERQSPRPHPTCGGFPGPGRRNPAVFMAIAKESTRCRRINTL